MKKYIPVLITIALGWSACLPQAQDLVKPKTDKTVRCVDPAHVFVAFKHADPAVVNALDHVDIKQYSLGSSGLDQPLHTYQVPLKHDKTGAAYFSLTYDTHVGSAPIYVWVFTVQPSGKTFKMNGASFTYDTSLTWRPDDLCSNKAVYDVNGDLLSSKFPYNDTVCTLEIPYQ